MANPPAHARNLAPARARAIMFQGTGSDVGKSLITAGLARALSNRGYRVKPFKPQNMSNNAAVTGDGGEIGRAQALQARAARSAATTDMNPMLLKPQRALGAQIIVQGKVYGNATAAEYQSIKPELMPFIVQSFERLKAQADFVLVEGAGSASEINLRANDIANMGFARKAGVPVVLIGDIDRGGVIASLVGTKQVIEAADAALIRGFIVNRFRGDPALFDAGMKTIARLTGWYVLGLLPHFAAAALLPAEDALALGRTTTAQRGAAKAGAAVAGQAQAAGQAGITIAVPILPHISNFDDLDPLAAEPDVEIVKVHPGSALPGNADLVILCGSKSTIADLAALREAGFDIDIAAHQRRGGFVLGICGGFQMLGTAIADPHGVEGEARTIQGLGLLDITTLLSHAKRLGSVSGKVASSISTGNIPLEGYLMHMGETAGAGLARPFAWLSDGHPDGAVDGSGRIFGSYVHGLFANDALRADWLKRLGGSSARVSYENGIDKVLDQLAEHLERHLDVDAIIATAAA